MVWMHPRTWLGAVHDLEDMIHLQETAQGSGSGTGLGVQMGERWSRGVHCTCVQWNQTGPATPRSCREAGAERRECPNPQGRGQPYAW